MKDVVLNSKSLICFKKEIEMTVEAISNEFRGKMQAFCGAEPKEVREKAFKNEIFPDKGIGYNKTLKKLEKDILPYLLKPSMKGYMAHLHSSTLLESIAAELIIASFNQSMDSWDQSPIATEVEIAVIKCLLEVFGFDRELSDGVITSGGTQSNLQAIFIARDKKLNSLGFDVKKHGLGDYSNKLRIYTSSISHFSVEKSAHILGLGYESVRAISVDDKMKMDTHSLRLAIEEDIRNSLIPFCVVATIGTTDFGSVDDIDAIYDICKEHNIHLHLDAAYGSGVRLSNKYKHLIGNIEKADSITVDFHKMLLLPISCSCVLFKDKKDLDALSFHSDYLNRSEDEEDGYDNLVSKSLQTTRRFDALKIYISFMTRGKDGYEEMMNTLIENARYFYSILSSSARIETLNAPELTSVVFRIKSKDTKLDIDEMNRKIRRSLMHDYGIIIGQTKAKENVFLQFTLLNPTCEKEDFDALLQLLLTF